MASGSARGGTSTPARRRYRSPLREQRAAETRAALLTAAHRLFVRDGWAGTGMRDVAAEAGVSTETVYAHFSSKRALLQAVMDIARMQSLFATILMFLPCGEKFSNRTLRLKH